MLSISNDTIIKEPCDKHHVYSVCGYQVNTRQNSKNNTEDELSNEDAITNGNTTESSKSEKANSLHDTASPEKSNDKILVDSESPNFNRSDQLSTVVHLHNAEYSINESHCTLTENTCVSKPQADKVINFQNSIRYIDYQGVDTEEFVRNVLVDNPKERHMLLQLEKEMIDFIKKKECRYHNFSPMSSYHRMIVHRIATYFGLDHNVDQTGRFIIVTKTNRTRIPEKSFEELIPQNEQFQKQILKRPDDCQVTLNFDQAIVTDDRSHHLSIEERQKAYDTRRAEIFSNPGDVAAKSFFNRQNTYSRTFRNEKRYHGKPKNYTRNVGQLFPTSVAFTQRPQGHNRYPAVQSNYFQYNQSNVQPNNGVKMMPCSSVILQQPYRYWAPVYPPTNYSSENDLIPALENMNITSNNGVPLLIMPTCLNNQVYFQNTNEPTSLNQNAENVQPVTSSSFSFMPYVLVNPTSYPPAAVTAQSSNIGVNNFSPNGVQYMPNTVFQQKQSVQQNFPVLQKMSTSNNTLFFRPPVFLPNLARKASTDSDIGIGTYPLDCNAVEVVGGLDANSTVRLTRMHLYKIFQNLVSRIYFLNRASQVEAPDTANITGLRIVIVFNRWISFELISQQVLPLQVIRCEDPESAQRVLPQ